MGILVGIPGLVICSRLRTGKWQSSQTLSLLGGSSQWWRLIENPPFVGYPIYQWNGKLWHKIFAAVRSVGWSSKNGSETRSLAKKTDKCGEIEKPGTTQKYWGPQVGLGFQESPRIPSKKTPQRNATWFWWLQSSENHEHCRCLVVGRQESPAGWGMGVFANGTPS